MRKLMLITVVILGLMLSVRGGRAQISYRVLYSFTGDDGSGFKEADGAKPSAALIQGPDGNFYGTTVNGSQTAAGAYGTVFKMDASGKVTILYSFLPSAAGDGSNPHAGLLRGRDGNFYGTTSWSSGCVQGGCNGGTVFRISASGDFKKLHTFGAEGSGPIAGLIQAADGNFYGTLSGGGEFNRGSVYKMSPNGIVSVVRPFKGGSEGQDPRGPLLQASDGNFYGTTRLGGGEFHFGTVFRMTPGGVLTVLHRFAGKDGARPVAGLIQASDGHLYGTTAEGGEFGRGVVFRMDLSGTVTPLRSFNYTDGESPRAPLIQAKDGSFYGTTTLGGEFNKGVVFQMDSSGKVKVQHHFPSLQQGDGLTPVAGLLQAADGSLYGTTEGGGSQNKGTVFRLDLGPPTPTPTPETPTPTPPSPTTPTPTPEMPTPTPTPGTPTPTPETPCESGCGSVNTEGRLLNGAGRADFKVEVDTRRRGGRVTGRVKYEEGGGDRLRFWSTEITCLTISGRRATILGNGRANHKPVAFRVEIEEGPRRGGGIFSITLSDGYSRSGETGGHMNVRACGSAQTRGKGTALPTVSLPARGSRITEVSGRPAPYVSAMPGAFMPARAGPRFVRARARAANSTRERLRPYPDETAKHTGHTGDRLKPTAASSGEKQ